MKKFPRLRFVLMACAALPVAACQMTQPELVLSTKSAVELRSMQSRRFETGDEAKVYKAVIATMLDLGYAITVVEPDAGTVTGNKLAQLDLTATVTPVDDNQTSVRANAVVKVGPQIQFPPTQVDAPEFYQQRFFAPLSKALFLEALYEPGDRPAVEATKDKN
jgi:hypothetical protein